MGLKFKKKNIKKIAFQIQSQVTEEEYDLLYDLASKVVAGCIVEIGSFHGRSTIALAQGSTNGGYNIPIYAIEPHEIFTGICGGKFGPKDRTKFFQNMLKAKCTEIVRLVNLSSEIVSKGWRQKVQLLWLDGDHTYEGVKRDFESWEPHLTKNAVIAFHDSTDDNLGPKKLINELLSAGDYSVSKQIHLTTVLQRHL
jgi:predicted O-methyltransferase YrrM